jgi:hypothetical protein
MAGATVETEASLVRFSTNGSETEVEDGRRVKHGNLVGREKTHPFFSLEELHSFTARPLNGRQCKNIVR